MFSLMSCNNIFILLVQIVLSFNIIYGFQKQYLFSIPWLKKKYVVENFEYTKK